MEEKILKSEKYKLEDDEVEVHLESNEENKWFIKGINIEI